MFTNLQYLVLKSIARHRPVNEDGYTGPGPARIVKLLGDDLLARARGKVVLDFGCGEGRDAIELAAKGAKKVIGLDIRDEVLDPARRNAALAGVSEICEFTTEPPQNADLIVSIDAFEHFQNPAAILELMARILPSDGEVLVSFGPTWLHPLGGHLFSIFPWAHLLFTEAALLRWRADFKRDDATRFSEVAGGLNGMTIKRFERMVNESALVCEQLECVPIRKLKPLHNRFTREYTSSVVRCTLRKP